VAASDREGVTGHPTPKPAKVWRWLVERVTPHAGQIVLDLFAGSGTTFIVAEETGRYCCGIEIDPIYCDVAITRWQNFTGREATLDGCTFAQVKETRMAVSA
jgi:DNA modification methylase